MAANTAVTTSYENNSKLAKMEPWEIRTLALGGIGGALTGLLAAFLLLKNAERNGVKPTVGAREGFQIIVLLFGLVRSIANLWDE